jgi:hypothetical protein
VRFGLIQKEEKLVSPWVVVRLAPSACLAEDVLQTKASGCVFDTITDAEQASNGSLDVANGADGG